MHSTRAANTKKGARQSQAPLNKTKNRDYSRRYPLPAKTGCQWLTFTKKITSGHT